MLVYGQQTKKKGFDRDSNNVAGSDAVLLIGLKKASVLGLDCAACGFPDCKTFQAQEKDTNILLIKLEKFRDGNYALFNRRRSGGGPDHPG
jgi:uncharacterized ferredoxin-like protein